MNILSLTKEEAGNIPEEILDWITSPENKSGMRNDKYWIINTNTGINNVHNNYGVEQLISLLSNSQMNNYQSIMILKNDNTPRSQSGDTEATS